MDAAVTRCAPPSEPQTIATKEEMELETTAVTLRSPTTTTPPMRYLKPFLHQRPLRIPKMRALEIPP